MATPIPNHALVVGASGLIGWSMVDQLLRPYPSPSTFHKVTALVNRSLAIEDAFWPAPSSESPSLSLISGVDLSYEDAELENLLKNKLADLESVTHLYYCAFKEDRDNEKEVLINVAMMRRVVRTIKKSSPGLQFVVYPGGTRGYGIYRPDGIFTPPLVEEMADQLPDDYKKTVAYPHYRHMLDSESADMSWSWCELCPDAIIGFTPNGSAFSLAGHWAVYLYAFKLVHGEGSEVPFPGVAAGYDSLFTETSAKTLARVAIHASLHPDRFQGRIFNVADSTEASSMRERWPQVAAYFGLKGVPPSADASAAGTKPSAFVAQHRSRLQNAGIKGVDIWNAAQLDSYGYWLTFDRQLSLARLRDAGFTEEIEPVKGWRDAFDAFRKADMVG